MQRTEANLEDHGRSKEQIDRLQAKAGEINGNSPCALGNGGGGLPPLRGYLSLENPPSVFSTTYLLADSSNDAAALNADDIFVVFEFVCVLDLYQETRADKVVSHNSVFV